MLAHAGATWVDEAVVLDNMLYSGRIDNAADRASFAAGMVEFFISSIVEMQQAA
jgi:hypothetical protein